MYMQLKRERRVSKNKIQSQASIDHYLTLCIRIRWRRCTALFGQFFSLCIWVPYRPNGPLALSRQERNQGCKRSSNAPWWLPVLWMMLRNVQTNLLAHFESTIGCDEDEVGRFVRIFRWEQNSSVIYASCQWTIANIFFERGKKQSLSFCSIITPALHGLLYPCLASHQRTNASAYIVVPSKGVSGGPLIAKCHSKISSVRGRAAKSVVCSCIISLASCIIRRTAGSFPLYAIFNQGTIRPLPPRSLSPL